MGNFINECICEKKIKNNENNDVCITKNKHECVCLLIQTKKIKCFAKCEDHKCICKNYMNECKW